MTATSLGTFTLGVALPAIPIAISELTALLAPVLGDASKLEAAIANPITLPDIAGYIAGLEAAIANALAALAALPGLTVAFKGTLSLQLGLLVSLVIAAQAFIDLLNGAVSAGGISLYAFDGSNTAIGTELQAVITADYPIDAHANALVLFTANPASWTAMSAVLKTS